MGFEEILKYPAAFAAAFVVTYALVPVVQHVMLSLRLVDLPGERRLNKYPIARGGGLAVFLGFHFSFMGIFFIQEKFPFSGSSDPNSWAYLCLGSVLLLFIGLIDDAISLRWATKLAGQMTVAVFMFSGGISVGAILGYQLSPFSDLLFTLVWFVALINAFNLIDGLDGLATGLAAIAALGLAGAALFRHLPGDALIFLALAGACLAFLRFNFNPARIFLGDSGSMFLGFTIAYLGLATGAKGSTVAAIGVPFLAVGVPIFDTMLAIWRRSVRAIGNKDKGSNSSGGIVHADMEHLHHRLLKAGMTQRRVALVLYGINAALVAIGLLTMVFSSHAAGIYVIAFVAGSYVVVRHLAQVELWDSGVMLLNGLRRPSRSIAVTIAYPIFDAAALAASLAVAVWFARANLSAATFKAAWFDAVPVWCGVPFLCLSLSGIYSRVWSRARISEFAFLGAAVAAGVLLALGLTLLSEGYAPERLILRAILQFGLSLTFVCGIRALPRTVEDLMGAFGGSALSFSSKRTNVLIYGAGHRGLLYLKYRNYRAAEDPLNKIIGFLDDDPNLRKRIVHGYRVHGAFGDLPQISDEYGVNKIVIAHDILPEHKAKLLEFAQRRNITLKEWAIKESYLSPPDEQKGEDRKRRLDAAAHQ